jgi:hypothetical protein
LTHLGAETELTDDTVFSCNRWDPLTEDEIVERNKRRELYQIRRKAELAAEPVEAVPAIDDDQP